MHKKKEEVRQKNSIPCRNRGKNCNISKKMTELGFGPTMQELWYIIQDFVNINGIVTPFTDGLARYDWTVNFMERHNLVLKKGGLMQIARKSVTSDPFVMHGFYEILETEVKRLGLENCPKWNCDETGFPMELWWNRFPHRSHQFQDYWWKRAKSS